MAALWLVAAAGMAAGGLFGLHRLAVATVRPPRTPAERHPDEVRAPRDEIAFEVDGRTLRGWLFRPTDASGDVLVVLVHGWSAASDRLFGLAAALVDDGLPVLAFDVRDHGRSDPAPYATLRQWRDDVCAGLGYARESLGYERIVLIGHSMGAAACAVATADGASVEGLVLLAPPADILEVTADYLRERGLPGGALTLLLRPVWRYWAGVPYARLRPIDRIGDVTVPVLAVQGDADLRVPPDHLDRFREGSDARTVRVRGAGHMELLDRPETARAVRSFVAEVAEVSA